MAQNPQPLIFSGVTPNQFAKLSVHAQAKGIHIDGNSGTASKFGVEVAWNYVPETGQLTFECLKAPVFVGAATIYAKLKEAVDQSLAV